MLELTLLGLHALRGADGRELTSLPAQPKRFALLAFLALGEGDGYHRRDTLTATFWPELDQFAARRALRNTLYHLREALGDGVIVTRGDDAVALDGGRITSDVARLRAAGADGRHEDVIDGYHGELLAGIHVADAGEAFEEWLSRERSQLLRLVLASIVRLADGEESAGNAARAAYWAQRACALVPGDETWLRRAMTLLDASHDAGSALRLYDAFARRLDAEFRTRPASETQSLAARIRAGSRAAVAGEPSTTAPLGVTVTPVVVPPLAAVAPPGSRSRRRLGVAAGVSALFVAGVIAAVLLIRKPGRPLATAAKPRVLVTVFENRTGDPAMQSLGRMTQDWLAQGLFHTELVDVVDPHAAFVQGRTAAGVAVDPVTIARRTGAAMVVSGSYYESGDTLFFQAGVMDVRSARIVRVVGPIATSTHAPVTALDELRSRVMTALASVVDIRASQSLGTGDVPPFEAYQAYVEGWDAFWHGDARRAEVLFLQAARRDTTFVAAAIAVATTAGNVGNCPIIDSLAHALGARTPPLDRIDRLSLGIAVARCNGQNEEMLRLALERADLEPSTSGVQVSAAAAALWAERPDRALRILQRINPAVDLGWSTDSTHFDYWSDLTEAYHLLGRHQEELAAADRMSTSAPLGRAWMRGRALAALGRPTAALAAIDGILSLPVEMPNVGLAPGTDGRPEYTATPAWIATWIARELAVHGDTVAARQAAMRAVAWYRNRPPAEQATPEERLVATWSLELLGDRTESRRIAESLLAADSGNVDVRAELASLAAESGDTARADSLDVWLAAQPVTRVGWSASIYRARIAALLGHGGDAIARAREALDEGAWPLWIHLDPAFIPLHARADFAALVTPRE